MKNILKKASAVVLSLSMMFSYITPVLADTISDAQQLITSAEKTLKDLKNEMSDSQAKNLRNTIDTLQKAIDDKDEDLVNSLSQRLSDMQADLTTKYSNTNQNNTSDDNNNKEVLDAIDVDFTTLQLWDQFKDSDGITYTVDDLSSNIYVGSGDNQNLYASGSTELPNFEITYNENGHQTWRKYVRLDDLCKVTKKDGKHICEIMHQTDMDKGEFYLKRIYSQKVYSSNVKTVHSVDLNMDIGVPDAQEISLYYRSYHSVNSKRFNAILQLVNGESENDRDIIDTYTYNEDQITSNEGQWSTETDKKGRETTVLIPDIETLRDKNGVIYVSLRFVSESLGAEVKWVSQENSKTGDDDDVYIQFYDDKEYCKDINYTFTGNNHQIQPKEFEKSLYITKESEVENISLNGEYTYTDEKGKTVTSDVDWKKVYILLTVPDNYPAEFLQNNKPLQNSILWVDDTANSGENYLWAKRALYGKYSSEDGTCTIDGTTYSCDLGEEINITGIILYKGVPIPIDLFNINDQSCSVNS